MTPVTTAQVADLLRQAELVDDALALYRKASEQAPGNPQYREYLGRVPAPAQAAGRGDGRVGEDRRRSQPHGQEPGPAGRGPGRLRLPQGGDRPAERGGAARQGRLRPAAEAGRALAPTGEVRRRRGPTGGGGEAGREGRAEDGRAGVAGQERPGGRPAAAEDRRACARSWRPAGARRPRAGRQLARYLEADGKLPEAVRAADRAVQVEPRSVPAWAMAARLRESAGNLADAADALRRLAEIDRKNRTEYLTGIAKLESRLGRVDAAIKAGRDLLAAAPGNPEQLRVLLPALLPARPVRGGARRPPPRRAGQLRTTPRSSSPWPRPSPGCTAPTRRSRCTGGPSTRPRTSTPSSGVVSRLTELYLQRNQFDRLLTRLQHQEPRRAGAAAGAGQTQQRDVAICRAQAYASSGDLGAARAEIEPLLAANARDTKLLHQLSKLAEEEGDLEGAARYQKQLNDLAVDRRGHGPARPALCALRRAGGSPGGLVEDGRGQERVGPSHPPGDRQPAGAPEGAAGGRDHRDDGPQGARRLGGPLPPGRGPGGAQQARGGRAGVPRPARSCGVADDEKSAIVKARTRDPKLQNQGARQSSTIRKATCRWRTASARSCEIRDGQPAREPLLLRRTTGQVIGLGAAGFRPGADGRPGLARQPGREARGSAKAEEVVAAFRKAAEKTPADVRAHLGLVLPLRDAVRQRRGVRRGPRPDPRRAHRPAGALGLSLRAGRPAARPGHPLLHLRGPRRRTEGQHAAARARTSWITCWPATRASGPAAPSWPRRRSSRTSPTS